MKRQVVKIVFNIEKAEEFHNRRCMGNPENYDTSGFQHRMNFL